MRAVEGVFGKQGTAADSAENLLDGLPLGFEVNRGQFDACVDFVARGRGYGLFLTSRGAVLTLRRGTAARH